MAQMLAPEVRSQFAQRLKKLRTQRGFDRARYFAKSLGIEENRYTRYERAEVEPSLTLIHKMCETLRVSPNELLGFADLDLGSHIGMPGLAEGAAEEIGRGRAAGRDGGKAGGRRGLAGLEPGCGGRGDPPRARAAKPSRAPTRLPRCARRARCSAACRPSRSARWPRSSTMQR